MAKQKTKAEIEKLRDAVKERTEDKAIVKPVNSGFRSILTLVK